MSHPFDVVRQFESDLCHYTDAPFCITTTSCTTALLLACCYHQVTEVEIPRYTYVGVPQSILNAGGKVKFRDENWTGIYQLSPYPIWDSARFLSGEMYRSMPGQMVCLSFHWGKTLGVQQGGAILLDDPTAYRALKKLRFDGRTEGIAPKEDKFSRGFHAYMSPEVAAQGVLRLAMLPKVNMPMRWDDYPDLSQTNWNELT